MTHSQNDLSAQDPSVAPADTTHRKVKAWRQRPPRSMLNLIGWVCLLSLSFIPWGPDEAEFTAEVAGSLENAMMWMATGLVLAGLVLRTFQVRGGLVVAAAATASIPLAGAGTYVPLAAAGTTPFTTLALVDVAAARRQRRVARGCHRADEPAPAHQRRLRHPQPRGDLLRAQQPIDCVSRVRPSH